VVFVDENADVELIGRTVVAAAEKVAAALFSPRDPATAQGAAHLPRMRGHSSGRRCTERKRSPLPLTRRFDSWVVGSPT
jgi:hypothetical protein